MWHTCNMEPISMVVPQFCTISRYQPTQHPGCMGFSVHLPPPDIMLVHYFCGKYSVKTLHLYHLISTKHHSLLALRGIPSMSSLWWIFAWGSGPKVIWSKCSCPTKKKDSSPHRDFGSVWQSHPENKVTGRSK